MTKKLQVAIIISALNEERNIGNLLSSLLAQQTKGFDLKNILVISDGSTDKTVEIAKSFNSKIVEIIDHKDRKGKTARLSGIFKKLVQDVFVVVDADITLAHKNVIREMVLPFIKVPTLGMVGGNSQPFNGGNFLQNSIASSFRVYSNLREKYNSLSFGPIIAYRSSLAKKINFPKELIGEDAFGYLSCLNFGFKYFYSKKSLVYIKLPKNLKEHISQNVRFMATPQKMSKYFPADLVSREDYISPVDLYASFFKELVSHPFCSVYIFLINQYCRLIARLKKDKLNSKWTISKTTK